MQKIKKGDLVQVITGTKQEKGGDKGKQGKVLKVFPATGRVLVEGINRVTKHTKVGQSQRGNRARQQARQIEHPQTLQRGRRHRHCWRCRRIR